MTSASARPRQKYVARILESIAPSPAPVSSPALILMAGLPGSGKSTVARRLAAATGAVILESDAIRHMLFGSPVHDSGESRALFAAIFEAAGRLLRGRHSVIVDATNLKGSDRRPAHELAATTGARLVIVHTLAPEAVILERLRRRDLGEDPTDHSLADEAVYRHMAETAQPITEDHWQIHTSDEPGAKATLARLVENLRLSGATSPMHSQVTGGSIS